MGLQSELNEFLKDTCLEFNRKSMDLSKVALMEVNEAKGVTIQNLKNIQERNLNV